MPEDDAQAALKARRIAELEAELHRCSATLANLQGVPDNGGHAYFANRIEELVAEIEALQAPAEEQEPERDGPPMHTVLLGIGLVVAAYGLTQRAWTALLIGVVLMVVSQVVKPKDADTDTETKGS